MTDKKLLSARLLVAMGAMTGASASSYALGQKPINQRAGSAATEDALKDKFNKSHKNKPVLSERDSSEVYDSKNKRYKY